MKINYLQHFCENGAIRVFSMIVPSKKANDLPTLTFTIKIKLN